MVVNEFFKSIARTLGRIFAYLLLGILAYFIFTWFNADTVKAETYDTPKYIILNSPSYSNVQNYTCYNNECPEDLTGNGQVYQQANFYWDYQFESGKTYEYQIQAQVITTQQITPNASNIGYVFRFITPGVVNATCDSECEVNYFYRGTTTYYRTGGVSLPTKTRVFIYEVAISGIINVNQNFQTFGINVNIGNIVLGSPYSYAIITDTSNETDKIIDNDNKNTDKIIQNNDKNTDRIVDSNGNTQYTINQNTQAVQDLNDTMQDESPSSNIFVQGVQNIVPSGPATDLLQLPFTMVNAIYSGFNSTCTPWSINTGPLLGNHTWIIPCINLQRRLSSDIWSYQGYSLWEIIDIMGFIFMVYEIIMLMINGYNMIAELNDPWEVIYVPKHGGFDTRSYRNHGDGVI